MKIKVQNPLCYVVGDCILHCVDCKIAYCQMEKSVKNEEKSKFML